MANEKNLKPFKKGVSGNPGGRPKWKQITEILKSEKNQEKLEEMINVVFERALKGDMRAVEYISDRLEGKVATRLSVERNDEPIPVFEVIDMRTAVEKERAKLLDEVPSENEKS